MCRKWQFLAVLRSFFHSPTLCTFPCHPLLHQLFFHPLSPHLTIYLLLYLSIFLFPNSYIISFRKFYFLPYRPKLNSLNNFQHSSYVKYRDRGSHNLESIYALCTPHASTVVRSMCRAEEQPQWKNLWAVCTPQSMQSNLTDQFSGHDAYLGPPNSPTYCHINLACRERALVICWWQSDGPHLTETQPCQIGTTPKSRC